MIKTIFSWLVIIGFIGLAIWFWLNGWCKDEYILRDRETEIESLRQLAR